MMLWVTAGEAFRFVSVRLALPVMAPAAVGVKLMGKVQELPAASDPWEDVVSRIGHVADASIAKFAEIDGFCPVAGAGKFSVALPLFSSVTVFGLSLLVALTAVAAKLSVGAST